MRPEILSLGFVNFHETCKALCKVSFSDVRKKVFCQELMRISEFFLGINATTLAPTEITAKKRDLDFFGNGPWHSAIVHEPSTILEAKDGPYVQK